MLSSTSCTINSGAFVLKGNTLEELTSSKALKIVATCVYAGIPLSRCVSSENEQQIASTSAATPENCITPPITQQGLRLEMKTSANDNAGIITISSTNASLRALSKMASPTLALLGENPVDEAIIDSWLSLGWSSFDLPVEVGLRGGGGGNDIDTSNMSTGFRTVLEQLDQHLLYRTYIASTKNISIADIRMVVSLYSAASSKAGKMWEPNISENDTTLLNVKRWYQTLTHSDWFVQSTSILENLSASTTPGIATSTVSSTSANPGGVMLNGLTTPVINKMYRRNRTRIKEAFGIDGGESRIGHTITVAGWSRTIRKASSKLIFVELNDGSTGTSLQCVLDIVTTAGFEQCKTNGGTGSSFMFVGTVVKSTGTEQVIDLQVTEATLLGAVYGGNPEGTVVGGMLYPLSKKEHTLEHMRDVAHLRPRGQIHAAAMRIRHAMAYATHTFFNNHGFLYIHTPILTGADCEGAGEQFAVTTLLGSDHLKPGVVLPIHKAPEPEPSTDTTTGAEGEEGATTEEKKISKSELKRLAKKEKKKQEKPGVDEADDNNHPEIVIGAVDYTQDFYGQRMNLTVSGQLNVETHACALSDVYTFGPTFRAEESRTYRHLSEFWMIEPEIAFATLQDDIDLAEDYLKYCVQYALEHCSADLEFFENNPHGEVGLRDRLKNVLNNQFKRLTYTEAIEILQKAVAEDGVQFEVKPEWGIDLPSEHERYICEKVFKMPVVLTNYPKQIKAFYMKLNEDNITVAAADILVPKIGEIIGGSQREHRYDVLKQRCVEMGLDPKAVWWYLDLRRYGTVPHAGFGLGFERLILFITGLDNIRDVIPFPRWVGNAKF